MSYSVRELIDGHNTLRKLLPVLLVVTAVGFRVYRLFREVPR